MELFEPIDDTPADDGASDWDGTDRRDWIVNGVVCSVIIAVVDGSGASAGLWLAATLARAYHGMPAIVRAARRLSDNQKMFYLDVVLGWALYPGPLVGSIFGALTPVICNLPISSFQGALVGLIVGPVIAAVQGVVLATLVLGVVWLVTGRRPN